MVYKKLLLSEGGGIISPFQQVEQSNDTVNILIGLGGTGIDCIRSIKTQVHNRIKPDGIDADSYKYSRIRFLGVDSDIHSCGKYASGKNENLQLADDEFLFIGVENIPMPLMKNPELSWFNYENINIPPHLDTGAGGIRQVGRLLMMEHSEEFIQRIEKEIHTAERDLVNPKINIHIFAGLCGGTGSGSFLDVCYIIRSITQQNRNIAVLGYFFLPDMILSKIPFSDRDARMYVVSNGYTAMQELDYCMALPRNGGSFTQEYQSKRMISWNLPPVDMCHVVSAMDERGHVCGYGENYGYGNTLCATTEYVMHMIVDSLTETDWSWVLEHANSMKTVGAQISYCAIGGACASIPFNEINTYLVSELFNRFAAIQRNVPGKVDVDRLAIFSLARDAQTVGEIYHFLYRNLIEDVNPDYVPFVPPGVVGLAPTTREELEIYYLHQTTVKCHHIDEIVNTMVSKTGSCSIFYRIQTQLNEVVRNIDRGPVFAYRMLSSSEAYNLLNIIDGLIEENHVRWNQEAAQSDLRYSDYINSRDNFEKRKKRSLFDNDTKRYKECEYYLMLLEQHKLNMHVFSKLDSVLRELRNQIVEITASYYIKLNRVMDTLINTFAENRDALASKRIYNENNPFSIPMMTIAELKKSLDTEIERINVPGMFDAFMVLLVQNKDEWIQEDENKISRMVIDFFVNTAFNGFANKTITSFLKDKYENKYGGRITDEQLAGFIYNDWMKLLTEKASTYFCFDDRVWSKKETYKYYYVAFPSGAASIQKAAKMLQENCYIGIEESMLKDRILLMKRMVGFPLSSYVKCLEYECTTLSFVETGRHYYEGKNAIDIEFSDWNKLPTITPQSTISMEYTPYDVRDMVNESNELFERASKVGVLDFDGNLYEADEAHCLSLISACDDLENTITKAYNLQDVEIIQQKIKVTEKLLKIPMVKIKEILPNDGKRSTIDLALAIQKDYFFAAPALHSLVRTKVEFVEKVINRANILITDAEEKTQYRIAYNRNMHVFCEAILTGVIMIDGRIIVYNRVVDGNEKAIILNKRGEDYPFNMVPLFQGFLSYEKLGNDEKCEIKNLVDERLNANAPIIRSVGKKLKEYLSEERYIAWCQLAANYDERPEIISFLYDMKKIIDVFFYEKDI